MLERILGIHPFTCAALGNLTATVTFFEWSLASEIVVPIFVLFAFAFVVLSLIFLGLVSHFIQKHYALTQGGSANPRKIEPQMVSMRLVASIGLTFCIVGVFFLVPSYFVHITLIMLGLWSFLYFWSCDPLPPGRVRSLLFV